MADRSAKLVLVTGASGKVGQHFIARFLAEPAWAGARVRALCHNRQLAAGERLEVVRGSMAERADVARAAEGATHVLHLATCKETPDDVIDVTVKGLFWLLEECRQAAAFERFVLIGGDAGMGHFVYPHPIPVTETQKHSAYAGCYALSKVLEEAMLEQYYIQYDLDGCCLRAPWIMEKDDFRYSLSFGDDVFGGPRWRDLVAAEKAEAYRESGAVPVMLDPQGRPVLRNFVHVWRRPSSPRWTIRPHGSSSSTSAWTSRSTTARWLATCAKRGGCRASRCPPGSTAPGWTTARRSSCWAGGRATTCDG